MIILAIQSKDVFVALLGFLSAIVLSPYIIPFLSETIFPNSSPYFESPSLSSDSESPQPAGSTIVWTANAVDPENDRLLFNFALKNESTGFVLKMRGWGTSDQWKLKTSEEDIGKFIIEAWVRDGRHGTNSNEWDDRCSDTYTLVNGWPIIIHNLCNKTIEVILKYKTSIGWITDGTWEIEPNSSIFPVTSNYEDIRASYETIFVYAYSSDKSLEWKGDHTSKFRDGSIYMQKIDLNRDDSLKRYELSLSCS